MVGVNILVYFPPFFFLSLFFISLCKFSVITTHGHFYITFLPLDLTVSISPYSRSSIFNGQTLFHSAICYNLLTIWVIFNIIHNAVAGFIIGYEGNEAKLYHWVALRQIREYVHGGIAFVGDGDVRKCMFQNVEGKMQGKKEIKGKKGE